ncbi:protein translocase subunit SecF [Ectothiorhodospira lacustris]|uniref:protein translocase subunit SecF n=1 Tax=Ectothiorhodospira lacustris TaxID=2899127 RepID=UPI001EE905BC|nr:protein translocase subunit SecF [Ectothiorhodospira lacustris]MCG5499808.1 protein translocase subunit SecF [Ectothiorhodospira lacustris]MCG5511059.1 protein translocase subunit SecF [Ectothiorhodospira lacustris]MCG5522789.1 protein translocase subunit SecF [Ectothiorhodospira lacustris]
MKLNFAKANIDFLGQRRIALVVSLVLIIGSLLLLGFRGLNFGIDFTGGTLIEVGYPEVVELEQVRSQLETGGFGRATVQYFGTSRDVLIRLAPRDGENTAELSEEVLDVLRGGGPAGVELRRVEFVGPQVGEELREQGGLAMIYALIGILIYVALRFEWRFSVGAVTALVHDVIITLGIFSLFWLEFDLSVLAAVLAVIGYSLNDTIVVYDRIRENFRKLRKQGAEQVMNLSVNETLARTIITGVTTLLVLLALYLLGGAVIQNFALALIIGIVVGTYSSIYVAAAVALVMGVDRSVMLPVKKEGAELDDRP